MKGINKVQAIVIKTKSYNEAGKTPSGFNVEKRS